ncbi:unnamed protein product [Absidia cylindrospora]
MEFPMLWSASSSSLGSPISLQASMNENRSSIIPSNSAFGKMAMDNVFGTIDVVSYDLEEAMKKREINRHGSRSAYFAILFLLAHHGHPSLIEPFRHSILQEITTNYQLMPVLADRCRFKKLNDRLHLHKKSD